VNESGGADGSGSARTGKLCAFFLRNGGLYVWTRLLYKSAGFHP
jgi:hypothetical protein